MKPVSDRRRRRDAGYAAARKARLRQSRGMCEVSALGCSWTADQIHHVAGRGGPDPHALSNLRAVCRECHEYVHAHPSWARERGFMRTRHKPVRPSRWQQQEEAS